MSDPVEQLVGRWERANEEARHAERQARQALRSLWRARGFTLLAVATLGLGIGACTSMYSLADAVLLRALPLPQPGRIMAVLETSSRFPRMGLSWPDYLDWKASNRVFAQLAATRGTVMTLDHLGPAVMVTGLRVTGNYFDALGVRPELGRTFTPGEDSAAGPAAVVVSDGFYRSRLGGNPGWIGRALDLDGQERTVMGVMPPGYPGAGNATAAPEFWTPLGAFAAAEGRAVMKNRGSHSLLLLGRLRPGVTAAQAQADLRTIAAGLAAANPGSNAGVTAAVQPYLDLVAGTARGYLLPLLGAAGMLLLVACASVANLLLARGAARGREAAIRRALGAGPGALLRQHAAEGLWLGLGGCGLGLLLAWAALRAVPASVLEQLPRGDQAGLHPGVVGAACGLGLLCAVVFAMAPQWQTRGATLMTGLRAGGGAAPAAGARLRRALILGEVALATVLLCGGGLLLRSAVRLGRVDVGFQPRGVLSFIVGLADPRFATVPEQQTFFRDAVERLGRAPGVAAAGGVFPLPLVGYDDENALTVVGEPRPAAGHEPTAHMFAVRGDYFGAMGIGLRRGRLFNDGDRAGARPVALVDTVFARRYLGGGGLGRQVNLQGPVATVVGVVAHVQDTAVADAPAPQIYVPQDQMPGRVAALSFVVKARAGGALALRREAIGQIAALDADQPVTDVAPMSARVDASTAPARQTLQLVGLFAALALAMALVGVYGLLAYTVVRRTREIGVRMALGASRGRVMLGVLGDGLRLAAAGAALGLLLALWLGRLAAGLLFGVAPRDPVTLVAAPLVLLAAVALACLAPALRASRTDPWAALRSE